jgi:hypothetical protein
MPIGEAIEMVRRSPARYGAALESCDVRAPVQPGAWSPSEYLWHMVDVLRIGAERLWTLQLDPGNGVPCWDENELAAARRYAALSPAVGLRAYARAVEAWCESAESTPAEAETTHPELGTIGAQELIRRSAHECHHHLFDIEKAARPAT